MFVRLMLIAVAMVGHFGCTGHVRPDECPAGRTRLDSVCVREDIADYVACVRAQGAKLDEKASNKLSAEAGYAGANAKMSSDVSSSLERTYAASDANTLEIIRSCRALHDAGRLTAAAERESDGPFGAVAMSPDSKSWGIANKQSSRPAAEALALRFCGDGACRVQWWYANACGAIAKGSRGVFYWAAGQRDAQGAVDRVLETCRKMEAEAGADAAGCTMEIQGCSGL